ncbi:MAG: hypothetical protein QGI52_04595 [Alphaproteobacteria bacterium]|nr:hypothetical protein [Alphaproteobacteria bacterium]MDP7641710.1 hypothetical protein [Alphaproteobacteria bacterium]
MITLEVGYAVTRQQFADMLRLDAFRHRFHAQAIGEGLQGFDKQLGIGIFVDRFDEGAIDLDDIDRQFLQMAE